MTQYKNTGKKLSFCLEKKKKKKKKKVWYRYDLACLQNLCYFPLEIWIYLVFIK